MSDITFVTGNTDKFTIGSQICTPLGINLVQASIDVDEVQSENIEYIAAQKAKAAYQLLQKPLLIRDDAWAFPGLNGFPGPYMKSINHWFTSQDFLRLTQDLTDRRAVMTQTLVYIDTSGTKMFTHESLAEILKEARGDYGAPSEKVISFKDDNGLSVSEAMSTDRDHTNRSPAAIWYEFAKWYKEYAA